MSHPNSSAAAASSVLSEAAQQTYPESALYVLATPIGNVCDVTLRALHVLTIADAVACEDTRNTSHLLTRYGISQTLIAAHEHNEREAADKIIARLQQGQRIALVSDAGTPAVSDPGARIVEAVRAAGLRVVPLPGASAAVTALSASGLVNDAFRFIGFLPNKSKQREHALQKLAGDTATLVFYEAPHRIVETIDALLLAFGPERHVVLGRELTKLFETVHRCPLAEAPAWLAEDANRQRGEFVVLVEGATAAGDDNDAEAERVLRILLEELPLKQAAGLAAQITGQKKNALYERALQIKDANEASN
ncbi:MULTISPECIES: 16S rRNA (cytidine(1402)-2'-O)-methyltransferase [unclassified Herbaspirillum]|uniref:16S rRNA (cytidine(1402)-2'-O)-methyltransferase n=1 Tax=unclassified Herbaspirillum TaxID=2624150 RepID=UPI000E2F463C|nr:MULTISPECIES: 16S rRNA (cytidine(1402)-2'-O)-methyltransferase [unclassified Herbaspirillum]RFB68075.1 16S rRNA (cytidine(1402)-2'-O)-methyltransferase [Herbaspirillum sp. 3R-3a1]TFI06520.1 16S rRNA (cytidine(1402)-2'-O)-methyltransferase [Herbaspirillum sp. 3R11]TFI13868.1 16S rRNA (cytidine(1402)-2'-O)-methyltransferase [Herbaspirillum sp. 3R-11]TFI31059.1 16S rRNA (cytidine(1402)-2'-O)-methyltransferase [Herbaspirillum sp. 3C11]